MNQLDLTGRTAIVTAGARGIGLAAAQAIAAAGGNVVLTARRQDSADAAAAQVCGDALGIAAHVVNEAAAQRCVDAAIDRFGGIDILVNNAGNNPACGPVLDQDYMRFTKAFGVNVWAPILWTSVARRAWMGEHGGVVINTAAIGGMIGEPGFGLYNASKAALIHLTEQLSVELSPKVRVNAIAQGFVRTKPAEALRKDREKEVNSATASARVREPEDIGEAIAVLASDAATWVTGETFVIGGGHSLGGAEEVSDAADI
ncbi:SDR family oxidoreductase [Nocardia sp. NPDC060259]|uniref:SDR family oxidoreductase n=1 Tax=Nocardia sp. NPDC060259 TaxID=3347088 RepID=UPI003653B08B